MEKEKLKLSDVIALARAGYTPKDVKEIMALNQSSEESPIIETQPAENSESVSQSAPMIMQDNAEATAPKASEQPPAEPDYKSLYEAEKEKVISLQNINNRQDVSGATNDVDLVELVSTFC